MHVNVRIHVGVIYNITVFLAHMFSDSDNQMLLHFSASKAKPAWPPGGRGSFFIPIPCLPLKIR